MVRAFCYFTVIVCVFSATASADESSDVRCVKAPACERAAGTRFELGGIVGDYLRGVTRQWLLIAPDANPGMLEMFRDRDREPLRNLEPWAGEFAGKYLLGAVQSYRTTHDEALRTQLKSFVRELCSLQDADGYLGPWPREARLTGKAPNVRGGKKADTWDAWGHYHLMLGLLAWYEETGDKAALRTATQIADLFCERFLGDKKPRLVDTGSTEMNLAPIHSLCLLYRATGETRYLELAKQIAGEFSARNNKGKNLAGDYLEAAPSKEFFQSPKPRWESLHPIQGLAELYYLTGDEKYRQAFEHWWWSIVKFDRHNNGGFSSGEKAQGNPYHQGAIETCCTIAWMAMSVDMLKLTHNSIVADELELSLLNSGLGLHSPTGRWATYNTPMDGVRKASAHDIVFQAREGTPELNCCSVNAARGLGLLSEWAVMQNGSGLTLNWYGPGKIATQLASGEPVAFEITSHYPRDGRVEIAVRPAKPTTFALSLRIPYWSAKTTVKVNGEAIKGVKSGEYLVIDRTWQTGDEIVLDLDFSLHFWVGERECAGKVSAYRGPILLTYDRRFNQIGPSELPALDAREMVGKVSTWNGSRPPYLLVDFTAKDGRTIRLCDFASAGNGGSPYLSWLKVEGAAPSEFSRENPLRSSRHFGKPK